MSNLPPDQQQRQQALDTNKSYIVQAPAGSGKTGLLTQRYLALLAQVKQPEEILSITFTRKATAEMKQRLFDALQMASGEPPEEPFLRITWRLAQKVLQRNEEMQWQLLQQPSRLKIQTIDGLCASLIRQLPLLSGLGGNLPTTDNASEIYQLAAKRTAMLIEDAEYGKYLLPLLEHFDGKLMLIKDLLADMLQKRLNWRSLMTCEYEREILQQSWSAWTHKRIENIARKIKPFRNDLENFWTFSCTQRALAEGGHSMFAEFSTQGWPTTSLDSLLQWQSLADLLLTKDGGIRKTVTKTSGFPAASAAKNKQQQDYFTSTKSCFVALLKNYAIREDEQLLDLMAAFREIRQLPESGFSDEHWQVLESLGMALKLSLAQLWLAFKEYGVLDFSEVAIRAQQALGDESQPTDLTLRLDYQIAHILIDEFQDTSQNQRQLLSQLTAGWQAGDGRTLFVVGDPMQSIYRFRAAEVSIFLEAWHSRSLAGIALECLQLQANFRSQEGIINWINTSFAKIFPQQDDAQLSAVSYAPSKAMKQPSLNDSINIFAQAGRNDKKEAEWIKQKILDIKQQNDNESIAVLVSNKNHLTEIALALRSDDIDFEAIDVEPLKTRPEIQDLYSLTIAMMDPLDRINWMAILRAPWCGLSLSDLTRLLESSVSPPAKLINEKEILDELSTDGRQRLSLFVGKINHWLKFKDSNDFISWLQSLWLSLGGPAGYAENNNGTVLANAQTFFLVLEKSMDGSKLSIPHLQQAMDMLFASADKKSTSPVLLMTMHKSKGLEFDHVFLPGLGKKRRHIDQPVLEWLEWPQRDGSVEFLLAPIKAVNEKSISFYKVIQSINKIKSHYEQQRLLYVATTRAKKQLYLSGHIRNSEAKNPEASSLLMHLWPVLSSFFSKLTDDPITPSLEKKNLLKRFKSSWKMDINKKDFIEQKIIDENSDIDNFNAEMEFSWASESARIVGIVAHKIFQQFAILEKLPDKNELESLMPWFKSQLQAEGVSADYMSSALKNLLQLSQNIVSSTRGQWILSSQHVKQKNEWALKLKGKNFAISRFVIDRSFVDENDTRWIIDYKTGGHEGGNVDQFIKSEVSRYRPQLQQYGEVVSKMEKRKIILALYFPALDAWSQWDFKTENSPAKV